MTIIPVLKSLVLDILSRSTERASSAAIQRLPRPIRHLANAVVLVVVTFSAAAAGQDRVVDPINRTTPRAETQLAQSTAPHTNPQGLRNAQIKRAQDHCRQVSKRFYAVNRTACIRGDRLDPTQSICIPPKGIFKPYSRWDPAAGRCKPRHRFDGGTCAGGKRRYKAGKHHAHQPSVSVRMYAKAPSRLAAAYKLCRRALTDLRSRVGAERVIKQRRCAQARQQGDRAAINFYCR